MASKKKSSTSDVGNLTLRHMQKLRADMAAQHAELVGVMNDFKVEVATSFRTLQDTLAEVFTDFAKLTTEQRAADRARMDALEQRIAALEKKAS